MLNGGCDDVHCPAAKAADNPEDGKIVRFRPATREHHFARRGTQCPTDCASGFFQLLARPLPCTVDARCVPGHLTQGFRHKLRNFRQNERSGVVIEIKQGSERRGKRLN